MIKNAKLSLFFLALCCLSFKPTYEEFCGIRNTAFVADEKVTMKVFYSTMGMYIGAGEAVFTTSLERVNGKAVYHCIGDGKTYSFFDNFYKVRDRYETYIDTANLLPYRFVRSVNEGGYKKYNNVTFNQEANTAVSTNGVFKVTPCIQDVVGAVYYARNINYDKYKKDDKITFDMFLDDEVYHMYIRYMGKEVIKTRFGKYHAIRIKPLLIKGTIFEGGEKMNAWLSDDPNHVLLRVESPISVGTIKVDLMKYEHLRYPLSSKIEE